MSSNRLLALVTLCAASLIVILDGTIVTVALPAIQADLGFTARGLSWVMDSYLIAFGGLLLLSGRLAGLRPRGWPGDADRVPVRPGRRRRDGVRRHPRHDRPAVQPARRAGPGHRRVRLHRRRRGLRRPDQRGPAGAVRELALDLLREPPPRRGRLARGLAGAARRPRPRPAGRGRLARRGAGDQRGHAGGAGDRRARGLVGRPGRG